MIGYTVKVNDDGTKFWYINGELHREDGPAIENADGSKYWFINGELHREDGPAVEYANGYKAWFLNDDELDEAEFNDRDKKELSISGIENCLVTL